MMSWGVFSLMLGSAISPYTVRTMLSSFCVHKMCIQWKWSKEVVSLRGPLAVQPRLSYCCEASVGGAGWHEC